MKIAIGSDHAGAALKQEIIVFLNDSAALPFPVELADLGGRAEERSDYPRVAIEVAKTLSGGSCDFGILVCGTGVGMCITANKVRKIRACNPGDVTGARLSRSHNDCNVLCLGGRMIGAEKARDIVRTFLTTAFEGGRHKTRVDIISEYEGKGRGNPT